MTRKLPKQLWLALPLLLSLLLSVTAVAARAKGASVGATSQLDGATGAHGAVVVGFSPGNAESLVVRTIDASRHSIRVAAYSFTSKPIAEALVAASRRGVDVKVVMDKSQRTAHYSSATFLANMGIPVSIDSHYAIMHNKFMVVDGVTVQTGSFNYTKSAQARNAENVVVLLGQSAVAATYVAEWNRLWAESEPYAARW